MGINVNGLGTNPYAYLASAINKSSSQTNKTEAYSAIFEGKIAQTEKVELTEEEKLEAFKKEIWKEIDSMSWGSNISVQITNSAFEKMMVDKEFKNKMMNIIREDAHGSNMMCGGTLINIDENGYKGYSYMQDHTKEAGRAFDAHSKDKDSFYSKKCKKDELNELWERERIKKRQYQEKADDEYMESLRLKDIFQHKEDIAKLYEEKTVKK